MLFNNRQKGFTIVELLNVIVVIGILAAITIVAFNGVQNRGKTSAAQSMANSVVKKIEAWNSVVGTYPTYCQFATNTTNGALTTTGTNPTTGATGCTAGTANSGPKEAKLDDVNQISFGAVTAATGADRVQVALPTTAPTTGVPGTYVHYWDFSNNRITSSSTDPASPKAGNP